MAVRSVYAVSFFVLTLKFSAFGQDNPECQLDQPSFVSQLLNVPIVDVPKITEGRTTDSGSVSPQDIVFLYYPPGSNDSVSITADNASTVIDVAKNTTFIVHGWIENGSLPWIKSMAVLLNEHSSPINVVAVDWSKIAGKDYITSSSSTHAVGGIIADFITTIKLVLKTVHLIGHSLGSHVVGSAGNKLGGQVDRITAADPASPLYEFLPLNRALTRNDAQWVDVIHTGWPWGYKTSCGKNDFTVNNGVMQPDCVKLCASDPVDAVFCSHYTSHTYYSLSIGNTTRFQGRKVLTQQTAYMGHQVTRVSGHYHVTTPATGVDPTTM